MAIDAFLDFSTAKPVAVKGEAQDSTLKNTFHIKSGSFSIQQVGTSATGTGLGAGKANFQDFSFAIDTQSGSPQLLKCCANGTHFDKVKLSVRKAGGKPDVYLTYSFTNVLITSYSTSLDEESSDLITLQYQAVYAEYFPQKADGSLDTTNPSRGGWDLKLNKEATS